MKEKIINIAKFLSFLGLGLFFLWLVYKDENIYELCSASQQANYSWIFLSLFLALISHLSRAMRWNILLQQLNYKPRLANTFSAILVMYLSNIAIPRSGEIARCGIIKHNEKIPLSKLIGTVFLERIVDMIILLFLLLAVLLTQFNQIYTFFNHNIGSQVFNIISSVELIIIFVVFLTLTIAGVLLLKKKLYGTIIYDKIKRIINDFIDGVKTITKLRQPLLFVFHSIFIYVMYFLMIYVCFFAFEDTAHLTLISGLTVFVMASFGMVAPSPGGIGTWHFLVIGTLFIYGVSNIEAKVFAIVVHGSMTLFLAITGFIALILLPILNKNK